MGCCGGSRRTTPSSSGGRAAQPLVGAEGMVLLEYVGGNAGTMTWYGPVTRTRYLFGKSRPRGYVDSRDVAGMLEMREGREALFQVVREETKSAPEPEPEPVAEGGMDADVTLAQIDVTTLSVAQIEQAARGADPETLQTWLEAEQAGAARVTALRAIRRALGEA